MLAWFVLSLRVSHGTSLPCAERALRHGVCGGSTGVPLALGTLGLCLLHQNIPAAVPTPRGLCLNCECCVNTRSRFSLCLL